VCVVSPVEITQPDATMAIASVARMLFSCIARR
jgi:hypothetical protein